ncbi:MAG: MarR family winged helix-turn-helix transcriptional regulator [Sulfolobales archaeon]
MSDAASKIVAAIERISRAYRFMIMGRAKRYGITLLQAQIIIFLSDSPSGRRRIRDLSQELGISQPAVSDSVNALVKKGLVVKGAIETDRRSSMLSLTQRGEELARDLKQWHSKAVEALENVVNREEKEKILEILLKYIASLHERGAIKVARTCLTCRYLSVKRSSTGRDYYCKLLNLKLGIEGLRLDCPEHMPRRSRKHTGTRAS